MECGRCGEVIYESDAHADAGADGHECKWCANLISCMHCHGVIDRDESYQHYPNGTYLCEECDSNLCCHSCGDHMGIDLVVSGEKYYHGGCMPDKAPESTPYT